MAEVLLRKQSNIISQEEALRVKYESKMEKSSRRMTQMELVRKTHSSTHGAGAQWKGVLLSIIILRRMRDALVYAKQNNAGKSFQFSAYITIRNCWLKSRVRRKLKEKRALARRRSSNGIRDSSRVPFSRSRANTGVGSGSVSISSTRPGSPGVEREFIEDDDELEIVEDFNIQSLSNCLLCLTPAMKLEGRNVLKKREAAAALIIQFCRDLSVGTRATVRAFIRRVKILQRLIRKHLKTNELRVRTLSMMMDRMFTMLPTHANLISSNRGLDKILDNKAQSMIERASIELYCKTNDSLLVVKGMCTVSFHKHLRENLGRIQHMLAHRHSVPLQADLKRKLLLDVLFQKRREYVRRQTEMIEKRKTNIQLSSVTEEEAKYFVKGKSNVYSDPVVLRLISTLGPAVVDMDGVLESDAIDMRDENSNSINNNMGSEATVPFRGPPPRLPSTRRLSSFVRSSKKTAASFAVSSFKEHLKNVMRKNFLYASSLTPEDVLEVMIQVHDKSHEVHRLKVKKAQAEQIEAYKKQKMSLEEHYPNSNNAGSTSATNMHVHAAPES